MYWDGKVIDEYSTEEIEAILPEMRRYAIIMPGPDWVLSYHYAKDLLKERRGCLKP